MLAGCGAVLLSVTRTGSCDVLLILKLTGCGATRESDILFCFASLMRPDTGGRKRTEGAGSWSSTGPGTLEAIAATK